MSKPIDLEKTRCGRHCRLKKVRKPVPGIAMHHCKCRKCHGQPAA